MNQTDLEQKIAAITRPAIEDMGLALLWVEFKAGTLTLYAENPKTGKLTLNDCTAISREISPLLEVADPIEGRYRLEVSSAGIDRPLFTFADYERFRDLEIKLETISPIEGQKKFRGFIRKAEETASSLMITLETDQGLLDLPFSDIYKAKLVMTDHLIKETKKRFEIANENNEIEIETRTSQE